MSKSGDILRFSMDMNMGWHSSIWYKVTNKMEKAGLPRASEGIGMAQLTAKKFSAKGEGETFPGGAWVRVGGGYTAF